MKYAEIMLVQFMIPGLGLETRAFSSTTIVAKSAGAITLASAMQRKLYLRLRMLLLLPCWHWRQ